jgi:hypothetical protein
MTTAMRFCADSKRGAVALEKSKTSEEFDSSAITFSTIINLEDLEDTKRPSHHHHLPQESGAIFPLSRCWRRYTEVSLASKRSSKTERKFVKSAKKDTGASDGSPSDTSSVVSLEAAMRALTMPPGAAGRGAGGRTSSMPRIDTKDDSIRRGDDPLTDGFLICTQLVKTGGADKAGLQVGDVFSKFGDFNKRRFPGLKAIATLVRRSPLKSIPVIVWRKVEVTPPSTPSAGSSPRIVGDDADGDEVHERMDDMRLMDGIDGTDLDADMRRRRPRMSATIYQKIALDLKPLRSHDADGGGVLGAVINTYPLPQPLI